MKGEKMNIKDIRERAFRAIMNNPKLRFAWNNALRQSERDEMMMEQVYRIGHDAGYLDCEADIRKFR